MCKKNQKYCPSLVVMLRTLCNMRNKEICDLLGYTSSAVGNIIARHGLADKVHYRNIDKDAIEAEYLAGATTYELGEKYGVCPETISKWMRKRGHVRGKGFSGTRQKADAKKRAEGKRLFEEWLTAEYGDRFTCLEYINNNTPYKLRCNECGSEFTRWPDKTQAIRCPTCYEKQLEQKRIEKEREKRVRKKLLAEEYAKEKKCCICGSVFHSEYGNAKFCSKRCRITNGIRKKNEKKKINSKRKRAAELAKDKTCAYCGEVFHSDRVNKVYCDKCSIRFRGSDHKARAEKYGVKYEGGITLDAVIQRDNNICQICGKPCDSNDSTWGGYGPMYPSIDHVIAMVNGGGHTWNNVQLAHVICNSYKRDLTEDELMYEVITHA